MQAKIESAPCTNLQVDGICDDDFPMLQVDGTGDGEGEQEASEETAAVEQQEGEAQQDQAEGEPAEEAAGIEGLADPEGQVGMPDGGDQLPLIDPTAGKFFSLSSDS